LSGQLAPLSLFPLPVQWLAQSLPFRWMVAFPVEVLLGGLSASSFAIGLAAQIIWLGLAMGLLVLLWKYGLRRYSAVGA
ncbi:MAG TPA: ABC-2 family transporter protein, partial [Ktedonobacteraceae bacterium]|nr:ABC-2 family transporter protein [Ktedonobacteraceae bacterium]